MIQDLMSAQAQAQKATVSQWCRVLGMSRSGWYAARQRATTKAAVSPLSLQAKAVFHASGSSYGSRRLSAQLKLQGWAVGRHKARTLMAAHGLRARWRRKFTHTTDSRHGLGVADNVLQRQFSPDKPNQTWASDITYVRTRSGWLYLAVVLDLFSRKVVGWAMAPSMPAQLVCEALSMAITSRRPKPGLLVHSDRGSQYASELHMGLLHSHGLVSSMSRKGNCWDNAVAESFFGTLKSEMVHRTIFETRDQAQLALFDYIEIFYNRRRLNSVLGYVSPEEFLLKGETAA